MAEQHNLNERRGIMLVLSSPSGAGKSTLSRLLLADDADISLSVSVTTRNRRGSEVDGVHYHFRDVDEFALMRDNDMLLEWAEVHGNYYATPRAEVVKKLESGKDVLFDIDWQGTLQLYEKMRVDIVSVFVLPPSIPELRQRLERRAEDSAEVIDKRLKNAAVELEHWDEYDYVLVNEDIQATYDALKAILASERLKRSRRPGLSGFVDGLQSDLAG